jgi:hypothetical protein
MSPGQEPKRSGQTRRARSVWSHPSGSHLRRSSAKRRRFSSGKQRALCSGVSV